MQTDNPFSFIAATDLSDDQIFDYWVELPRWKALIDQKLNPRSPRPIILFGGKGSGKTHLLRHRSFPVQKRRHPSNIATGVCEEGYIGIYSRFGALNATNFKEKGESSDVWQQVFAYYLELWFGEQLLEITREILISSETLRSLEADLVRRSLELFDEPQQITELSIPSLIEHLRQLRKVVASEVNNRVFKDRLDVSIPVSSGRLLFGLPDVISECIPMLENVRFVYMLDEFEALEASHQQYINTLMRERSLRTTFIIGSRLHGVRTYEINGSGEENRPGSEFDIVVLDEIMREDKREYATFARQLAEKRLSYSQLFVQDAASCFEKQSEDELLRYIISKERETLPPYFVRLRANLIRTSGDDDDTVTNVIRSLANPSRPDLEIVNTILLYRRMVGQEIDIEGAANEISSSMRDYLNNDRLGNEHEKFLSKFKEDVWAQLLRDFDMPQSYQGFSDLVIMSEGLPRTLLVLLKNIFDWSTFYGETPFRSSRPISRKAQTRGLRETAEWFKKDDKMLGRNADLILSAIDSLGNLFRENRFADRPSECSLIAFSVDYAALPLLTQELIRDAERLSLLINIPRGHRDKNSRSVQTKYQLSRTLSPLWDLPLGRRGTLALPVEVVSSLFGADRTIYLSYQHARNSRINYPFGRIRQERSQLQLSSIS